MRGRLSQKGAGRRNSYKSGGARTKTNSRGSKGRGSKGRGSRGRGSRGRGSKGRGSRGRGSKGRVSKGRGSKGRGKGRKTKRSRNRGGVGGNCSPASFHNCQNAYLPHDPSGFADCVQNC